MKISIVGTGNVAFHLGKRLMEQGVSINQVIGRDLLKTTGLADILKTKSATFMSPIDTSSDVFVIAVSDTAIAEVAEKLSKSVSDSLVVHTSGSIPSTVLQPFFRYYGAFYPLQTFSMGRQPNFETIPVFINFMNPPPQYPPDFLRQLAQKVSPKVYDLSDEDRLTLHVAAVFVNNFVNHLFKIGSEIVGKQDLPFDVLLPLIEETVHKIRQNPPSEMQTGPAKRGDDSVIEKHLAFIEKHTPQYDLLYTLLSTSINPNLKINR
jgi:predicted short-subunit dehydrogenase-like oxidoreductase (DUF2520 family)